MTTTIGYKLTHDNGFAPNPFHGFLTLATCRPPVRRCRKVGDWVAGFASHQLVQSSRQNGVGIPFGGLVYLMQVTEVMPLSSYFEDQRFTYKIPQSESMREIERCGDNIYFLNAQGKYDQLINPNHGSDCIQTDLSGVNALISNNFYYLGRKCQVPEGGWNAFLGEDLSGGRLFKCPSLFVSNMISYFEQHGIQCGVSANPCLWETEKSGSCGKSASL